MKKIMIVAEGYEPWLPKGYIAEVVGDYKGQPIIKDITGQPIRLDKKSHYEII